MMKVDRKDDGFLQWFLDAKECIENLKHIWRGHEENDKGQWIITQYTKENRIMNERGIHWATSILRSYLNKNFQATSWNEEHMNYEMKQATRTIWHSLMVNYNIFGLTKIYASNVGRTMVANIHSMMLSARGAGIRDFIATTQTISEQRHVMPQDNRGFFSGLTRMFRPNQGGQQ